MGECCKKKKRPEQQHVFFRHKLLHAGAINDEQQHISEYCLPKEIQA